MLKHVVIILFFLALFIAPAFAQDFCDPLNISIQLTTALTDAQQGMADGDDLSAVFDQLEQQIQALRSECAPGGEADTAAPAETASTELSFEGTAATVIGPLDIPAGTYRLIATTNSFMIAELSVLSGECGGDSIFSSTSLFNLFPDQANDGAEIVFISEGCEALLKLSNIFEPWTLEFEKLG